MALIDYTTYDEVRALLGVSDEEIENVTLALPIYSMQLDMALESVNVNLPALYETAKASGAPTALQKRLLRVTPVFAAYYLAGLLLMSLPMFGPKKITDGKAEVERVTDPYKHLREELPVAYQRILAMLLQILEDLGEVPVVRSVRSLMEVSVLATDPVTGDAR